MRFLNKAVAYGLTGFTNYRFLMFLMELCQVYAIDDDTNTAVLPAQESIEDISEDVTCIICKSVESSYNENKRSDCFIYSHGIDEFGNIENENKSHKVHFFCLYSWLLLPPHKPELLEGTFKCVLSCHDPIPKTFISSSIHREICNRMNRNEGCNIEEEISALFPLIIAASNLMMYPKGFQNNIEIELSKLVYFIEIAARNKEMRAYMGLMLEEYDYIWPYCPKNIVIYDSDTILIDYNSPFPDKQVSGRKLKDCTIKEIFTIFNRYKYAISKEAREVLFAVLICAIDIDNVSENDSQNGADESVLEYIGYLSAKKLAQLVDKRALPIEGAISKVPAYKGDIFWRYRILNEISRIKHQETDNKKCGDPVSKEKGRESIIKEVIKTIGNWRLDEIDFYDSLSSPDNIENNLKFMLRDVMLFITLGIKDENMRKHLGGLMFRLNLTYFFPPANIIVKTRDTDGTSQENERYFTGLTPADISKLFEEYKFKDDEEANKILVHSLSLLMLKSIAPGKEASNCLYGPILNYITCLDMTTFRVLLKFKIIPLEHVIKLYAVEINHFLKNLDIYEYFMEDPLLQSISDVIDNSIPKSRMLYVIKFVLPTILHLIYLKSKEPAKEIPSYTVIKALTEVIEILGSNLDIIRENKVLLSMCFRDDSKLTFVEYMISLVPGHGVKFDSYPKKRMDRSWFSLFTVYLSALHEELNQ